MSWLAQLLNRYQAPREPRPTGRDLVLGKTRVQQRQLPVILREEMRPLHLAVMGLSGMGKSYLLENLIRQDVNQGTGFVVFDVHGDLADNVLAYIAQRSRDEEAILERVVLIEPFDETHTIGFNPLEQTERTSAFLQAQELAHILHSRWQTRSFGPRTEELLRSALYTLSAQNLTLLDLPRLLTDTAFRRAVVENIGETSVADYWKARYEALSDRMQAAAREPLLTRISAFLADPQVREIVGQERSTFSFDTAIGEGLWIIVNLSQGRLGIENSTVLGSLLFTKLELDVMAQARRAERDRKLFAVYADELQNLAGSNFAKLIAEARKYRIALAAGHQFWHQLSTQMRAAMLSVGSRIVFRLSHYDARQLAGELDPRSAYRFAEKIPGLERGQAVFRSGASRAVLMRVDLHDTPHATPDDIERLRMHARARFAVLRATVRDKIRLRFETRSVPEIRREREESEIRGLGKPPL